MWHMLSKHVKRANLGYSYVDEGFSLVVIVPKTVSYVYHNETKTV